MRMDPAVGCRAPRSARSRVVLPAPEGPTMPTNAPGRTTRVRLSSTGAPSKAQRKLSTSIAGTDGAERLDGTTGKSVAALRSSCTGTQVQIAAEHARCLSCTCPHYDRTPPCEHRRGGRRPPRQNGPARVCDWLAGSRDRLPHTQESVGHGSNSRWLEHRDRRRGRGRAHPGRSRDRHWRLDSRSSSVLRYQWHQTHV